MKILIEDKEYIVTDDVLKSILDFLIKLGLIIYDNKAPSLVQAALEGLARKELCNREKEEPDKKEYFRPKKRESFVKHLAQVMKDDMVKQLDNTDQAIGLRDQQIGFRVNEHSEIVSIEFQDPSQTGGSLVTGGNVG